MGATWIEGARRGLLSLADGGGWGYRRGGPTAVEATALAALGLIATDREAKGNASAHAERAADRLAGLRRPDGSLGPTSAIPSPGWATPFAMLLWRALGSHEDARRSAAGWLIAERVDAPPRSTDGPSGHDTSIPGWPWVEGTHSWVEPTALALLALGRDGADDRPRVVEGRRVLRDRMLRAGGWNYGNTVVFGHALRPHPAPTGLALLAMAASGADPGAVGPSLAYLRSALPSVRAAASLGWGLLGLRAWGVVPTGSGEWLAESARAAIGRDDAAPRLGILLLAAGEAGLATISPQLAD